MASIRQINSSSFQIIGDSLITLLAGNIVVLFKTATCPSCHAFEPIFVNQAMHDQRVQYAIYNVSTDPKIPRDSLVTKRPIKQVPTVLFFSNQRLVAVINKRDSLSLSQSINDILEKIGSVVSEHEQYNEVSTFAEKNQKSSSKRQVYTPEGINTSAPGGFNNIDNDRSVLLIPHNIIPYNTPWTTPS